MSSVAKCDGCGKVFTAVPGTIQLQYSVRQNDGAMAAYTPDDSSIDQDWFDLCLGCSDQFKMFIHHKE